MSRSDLLIWKHLTDIPFIGTTGLNDKPVVKFIYRKIKGTDIFPNDCIMAFPINGRMSNIVKCFIVFQSQFNR